MMSWLLEFMASVLAALLCGWFLRDLALLVWPQSLCPTLRYKDCTLTRFVLKKVVLLRQPYRPPLWARNSCVQTLVWYLNPGMCIHTHREWLQMKDKGVVGVDWIQDAQYLPSTCPVLLLVPALHQNTNHLACVALDGLAKGMRPVVFHRRGHSSCPLTTPRLQAVGDPADLHNAVRFIRARWPLAKVVAMGESSGASLLLSFLGEYGSSAHVSASVVISPWWDAQQAFEENTTAASRVWQWLQTRALKKVVSRHAHVLESHVDLNFVLKCTDLCQFEQALFAKLNGYADLESYWERNSPNRDVDDIAAPVLAINAADDPIYASSAVPYDLANVCPNFIMATTDAGGHGAFLEEDASPTSPSWAAKVALDYVQAVLEFENETVTGKVGEIPDLTIG